MVGGNLTHLLLTQTNVTDDHNKTTQLQPKYNINNDNLISIEVQLKPALLTTYENLTAPQASAFSAKCVDVEGCPIWYRSELALDDTLSMIGNVSSGTGILILQGENDSSTPVQQGLLLQQKLTEVNHPDHLIITYPDLGHIFFPSSEWIASVGPIEEYVLQDMFEWLKAHSGLSYSYVTTTTASTIGANTSSLNTSTTSPSSSSGKR